MCSVELDNIMNYDICKHAYLTVLAGLTGLRWSSVCNMLVLWLMFAVSWWTVLPSVLIPASSSLVQITIYEQIIHDNTVSIMFKEKPTTRGKYPNELKKKKKKKANIQFLQEEYKQ